MKTEKDIWRITLRGGNYVDDAWATLCEYRAWFPLKSRDKVVGLRLIIRKKP